MLRNTKKSFGTLSKFFHWLIVALVSIQFYLVWGKNFLTKNSPLKIEFTLLHKSLGLSIFMFVILWIIWRLFNEKPVSLESQFRWKYILSKIVHHSIIILLLLLPILGYLMSCASGRNITFFGLVDLPVLISKNENLDNLFFQLHEKIGYLLCFLICAHAVAALHHHFILKDNVLKRMLP